MDECKPLPPRRAPPPQLQTDLPVHFPHEILFKRRRHFVEGNLPVVLVLHLALLRHIIAALLPAGPKLYLEFVRARQLTGAPVVYRRKLNLKATIESNFIIYYSLKH